MGLLFGSVGAHTCQESRQVPPPSFRRAEFSHTNTSNIFCNIISWHTGFLPGISFRGQYLLFSDQVLERAKVSEGDKRSEGGPLPIMEEHNHLSSQSFCPVAFTYDILQFCLFWKDFFSPHGFQIFLEF